MKTYTFKKLSKWKETSRNHWKLAPSSIGLAHEPPSMVLFPAPGPRRTLFERLLPPRSGPRFSTNTGGRLPGLDDTHTLLRVPAFRTLNDSWTTTSVHVPHPQRELRCLGWALWETFRDCPNVSNFRTCPGFLSCEDRGGLTWSDLC